ncbi:MAG: hypothetical protein KY455_02420 [Euryarchaeota archaeon]|nr:hypothetical protein [Euryarchaeota archaeon]
MPATPLVLFAHAADAETVRVAAAALGGVADVRSLPEDPDERRVLLPRAVALLVAGWRIPDDELPFLDGVRFVQRVWAGAETLPFRRMSAHAPVAVFAANAGPNAPQVAEHAIALYLAAAKRIVEHDAKMRRGGWDQEKPSASVAGSRIAVAGWGHVGRRVGRALSALGADVVAIARSPVVDQGVAKSGTLADLRAWRGGLDGLVLALPLTNETRGLVDRAFLEGMKREAILVNVARGKLVVEEDLHAHLVHRPSFRVGLDVWWHYPKADGRFRDPLGFASLPNMVMTPHCAFHVPGARATMVASAARNVGRFLRGEAPEGVLDPAEYR